MILALCFLACAIDESISLVPPLESTNLSEIGNWTLVGASVNMKRFVRLTPNIENQVGFACLRVPTFTRDWALEVELSVHDGTVPGSGFYLYFTSEVCPTFPLEFKGFTIWIDSSRVDKDHRSPVYYQNMANATADDGELVGHVDVSGRDKTLSIHLSRRDNHIIMDASHEFEYERVFEKEDNQLIDYGYFSVAARTEEPHSDAHDLISARIYPMARREGESGAPDVTVDWSSVNRKVIENEKRQRKIGKNYRRQEMPTAFRLLNESRERAQKLDGLDGDLRDAMKIVAEARNRMAQGVSVAALQKFIGTTVDYVVDAADRKMILAGSRFEETSQELEMLWSHLRTRLMTVAIETAQEMDAMRQEFEQIVKTMKLDELDIASANSQLGSRVAAVNEPAVTLALSIVALIEGIAYVIFFFVKRAKTDNFKKLD